MPMPASTNAITANAASTRTCAARDAVSRSTTSVIVLTSVTGSVGSICWMMRADRRGERLRRRRRAHDERPRDVADDVAVGHLPERQVDLRLRLLLEAAHPHVADHAGDDAIAAART